MERSSRKTLITPYFTNFYDVYLGPSMGLLERGLQERGLKERGLQGAGATHSVIEKKPVSEKKQAGTVYPVDIVHEEHFTVDFFSFDVYVKENRKFKANFSNIMPDLLSLKTREDCLRLTRNPLSFYQNQFNMAVWFATTACGISVNDHLNHEIPMIRSLYRFHTYYQMMKIFKMLQIPLPGDAAFNEINNGLNRQKLKELLSEFSLSDEYGFSTFNGWDSWTVPDYDPNITDPGYYVNNSNINFMLMQVYTNKTPPMFKSDFEKGMANFKYRDTFIKGHVKRHKNVFDVITQKPQQTYQHYMSLKSDGSFNRLTRAGISSLNDSIRTYVYCVLGAQAETRTPIVDCYGTELDAQKQFKKLAEDSYSQHVDIPTSIARYEKAISDTHIRLDYVIAPGLYIISSDMVLKVGSIVNYNNNILIATGNLKPGKNDINGKVIKSPPLMQGETVKTVRLKTNHVMSSLMNVKSDEVINRFTSTQSNDKVMNHRMSTQSNEETIKHRTSTQSNEKTQKQLKEDAETHENIKFLLAAVGGVLVSIAFLFR